MIQPPRYSHREIKITFSFRKKEKETTHIFIATISNSFERSTRKEVCPEDLDEKIYPVVTRRCRRRVAIQRWKINEAKNMLIKRTPIRKYSS